MEQMEQLLLFPVESISLSEERRVKDSVSQVNRGGANDLRSALCFTYIQLLESMRPKWFVWENVPGVFSTNDGNDFKEFIRQIDAVGYHVAWRVLDAQYVRVDGYPRAIPQRRRRVFAVGHLGGWEYSAGVLFEPDCLFGDTPPRRLKGKGFTTDAERRVGTASRLWDASGVNPTPQNFNGLVQDTFASSSHGRYAAAAAAGTLKSSGGDIGGGSENLATFWNGDDVSTTLTEAFADDRMPDKGKLPCDVEKHDQQAMKCYSVDRRNQTLTEDDAVLCNVCRKKPDVYQRWDGECTIACDHCIAKDTITAASEHEAVRLWNERNTRSNSAVAIAGNNAALIQECYVKTAKPTFKGDCETYADTGVAPTINCFDQGDKRANELVCETVAIAENIIGRQVQNGGNGTGAQEELAYTQNTSGVMGVANHATVRRLLPIECERLMGFPDNWTRIPWKGKPEEECPDSPRYKACGNSMCVNVMRWIGMRIENIERKMK